MISSVDHLIIAVKDLDQAISDYEKILGITPCWKGKHNELGTRNALFNFENTYLELLSPCDVGPGTELVNTLLAENGDHLAGIVLGTKNIEHTKEALNKNGHAVEISSGETVNEKDGKIRKLHGKDLCDRMGFHGILNIFIDVFNVFHWFCNVFVLSAFMYF